MAGKRKILAVDDNKNIVRLIQINLMKLGYDVDCAYDGVECLKKVAVQKPDLIVLDIMMPRKDGFQTLKDLKSNPETADIPIIMLTAKAQDGDILKGWQSGVDCYLTKPFNPAELIAFVKRIFAHSEDKKDTHFDGRPIYTIDEV
jgi:two-component system alkaline phosphatase synthesis response regulator PhoP/two-component system response regulator VicR